MTKQMNIWDDAKVLFASATGLGVQFTDLERYVKFAVGIATLVYIVTKIVKLWQNKKED